MSHFSIPPFGATEALDEDAALLAEVFVLAGEADNPVPASKHPDLHRRLTQLALLAPDEEHRAMGSLLLNDLDWPMHESPEYK